MSAAVILASKSPTRAALLTGAGIAFEAVSPGVDEDAVKAELLAATGTPRDVAIALADRKALAVSSRRPGLVIGADQTLEFERGLYDKVDTLAAAHARLRLLRGERLALGRGVGAHQVKHAGHHGVAHHVVQEGPQVPGQRMGWRVLRHDQHRVRIGGKRHCRHDMDHEALHAGDGAPFEAATERPEQGQHRSRWRNAHKGSPEQGWIEPARQKGVGLHHQRNHQHVAQPGGDVQAPHR